MKLAQAGIDLIKEFESCRLTVYLDLRGLATVGWGQRTTLPVGTVITQSEADKLLVAKLDSICADLKSYITAKLTDNQFSALVCLAYNIGDGNFKASTLLNKLNSGDLSGAAGQFERWDMAAGTIVQGLLRRRLAEKALFKS